MKTLKNRQGVKVRQGRGEGKIDTVRNISEGRVGGGRRKRNRIVYQIKSLG